MNTELMNLEPGRIERHEVNAFEMKPKSLEEAMKFAEIMANSDLVPSGYKGKPGNILVACQMGHELGMTPMRALRAICVINGRATLWGDDLLAMVLNSPICEYVNEAESTDQAGVCKVKRKGHPEHVARFTLEDARRAGLLGKQGPWTQHTGRMLKLRARGFALRDKFADILAGLIPTEEAMDLPPTEQPVRIEPERPQALKEQLKAKVEELGQEPKAAPEPAEQQSLPTDTGLSDEQWNEFIAYIEDDKARLKLKKTVKDTLGIGNLRILTGEGRAHFIRSMQEAAKQDGVPFEAWIKG